MTEEEVINGIVPIRRKEVTLLLETGYLCMELNRNDEAKEIFEGMAALVPHSEVPHMALGHLYFSLGHFNPAQKAHQKAIRLNPESAAAHAYLGETLIFLRKADQARKHLEQAIELEPEGPAGEMARALKEAVSLGVFG